MAERGDVKTTQSHVIPEPPLQPPEPRLRGWCAWCGEEIYVGNRIYTGDEGLIHRGCILPLMADRLGADFIAAQCGYREDLA